MRDVDKVGAGGNSERSLIEEFEIIGNLDVFIVELGKTRVDSRGKVVRSTLGIGPTRIDHSVAFGIRSHRITNLLIKDLFVAKVAVIPSSRKSRVGARGYAGEEKVNRDAVQA